MVIKKYDRFISENGDEVIEYTGLHRRGALLEILRVFKVVVPRIGERINEIAMYTLENLAGAGFKELLRTVEAHPLLSEMSAESKINPEFMEELIEFGVVGAGMVPDEERNKLYRLLKKHVPVAWLAKLESMPLYSEEKMKVIMPHALTAENEAKALLIGKFYETAIIPCSTCEINGYNELCEECNGAGEYALEVPVRWTTIKAIYRKAVDNLKESL